MYFEAFPSCILSRYNSLNAINSDASNPDLLSCTISLFQEEESQERGHNAKSLEVDALLDNGSLAGDFISTKAFNYLQVDLKNSVDGLRLPICSGLDGECYSVSALTHLLLITFISENNTSFSFSARFRVLPKTPFDIIIGRNTIKEFNLAYLSPSHFFKKDVVTDILSTTHPLLPRSMPVYGSVSSEKDNGGQEQHGPKSHVGCSNVVCGCQTETDLLPDQKSYQIVRGIGCNCLENLNPEGGQGNGQGAITGETHPGSRAVAQTYMLVSSLVEQVEQLFVATTPDEDDIDYAKTDAFAPFLPVLDNVVRRNTLFPNNPLLSEILIEGDDKLQSQLVILISRFQHIFSNSLQSDPAAIPPFDLIVDTVKWNSPKNRGPPRVQSPAKQAETAKQIDLLLSQGIIERSAASYYSQILLTHKPPNGWRFLHR